MKLVIDVPEWAQGRHIYVMAGLEMVAYKPYGQDILFLKTDRCNSCGKCCTVLPAEHIFGLKEGTAECIHLGESIGSERLCDFGAFRPFGCSVYDPILNKEDVAQHCSIKYRSIRI